MVSHCNMIAFAIGLFSKPLPPLAHTRKHLKFPTSPIGRELFTFYFSLSTLHFSLITLHSHWRRMKILFYSLPFENRAEVKKRTHGFVCAILMRLS